MNKEDNRCNATLHHGPGHQSRTRCTLSGPHTVHECTYWSEYGESVARWRGDNVSTGYFNEPPPDTDELERLQAIEQCTAAFLNEVRSLREEVEDKPQPSRDPEQSASEEVETKPVERNKDPECGWVVDQSILQKVSDYIYVYKHFGVSLETTESVILVLNRLGYLTIA